MRRLACSLRQRTQDRSRRRCMTIENRTGLVRRDQVQTNTIDEIVSRAGHSAARALDAFDANLRARGYTPSPAERMHYLQMMLASGFAEALAQQVADAVVRELWASTMRPAGNQPYQPPFYDGEHQALGPHLLEQFFVALGVPPQLAASAAQWFAQMIAPPQFYQPFYAGLGGQGDFNLDRLRQLIAGRGGQHSEDVRAQRLRNQTQIRPG